MTVLSVFASLFLSLNASADATRIQGPLEYVVCMDEGRLNVRGDNLDRVLFGVPNHEPLKVFQGWGENRKKKNVDGRVYQFVKVQFPGRESRGLVSVGWVADSLVKPRSECPGVEPAPQPEPSTPAVPATPVAPAPRGESSDDVTGLHDSACCQFPTVKEPTADYTTAQRRFAAGRHGRLHAACDLYRNLGEPIVSVAPGRVIRDKYFFYQGTYALEVRHSGGFVVRYGEVTGRTASRTRAGDKVKMGQTVAYMGKVSSNCCEPMLHFELYSGARNGSLSGGGAFQRRSDLLNPTEYLRKWEENTFRSRR